MNPTWGCGFKLRERSTDELAPCANLLTTEEQNTLNKQMIALLSEIDTNVKWLSVVGTVQCPLGEIGVCKKASLLERLEALTPGDIDSLTSAQNVVFVLNIFTSLCHIFEPGLVSKHAEKVRNIWVPSCSIV